MAAMVQPYLSSSGTVTMLQPRGSATPAMVSATQNQVQYMQSLQGQRGALQPGPAGISAPVLYRNNTMQPYAFPAASMNQQWRQQVGGAPARPVSMAGLPQFERSRSHNTIVVGQGSMVPVQHAGWRDDSSLPVSSSRPLAPTSRPLSGTYLVGGQETPTTPTTPTQTQTPAPSRPAPGRYRQHTPVDDMHLNTRSNTDDNKRMRRRSMHTLEPSDYPPIMGAQVVQVPQDARRVATFSSPQNFSQNQGGKPTDTLRIVSPNSNGQMMRMTHNRTTSVDSGRSVGGHSRSSSYQNRTPNGIIAPSSGNKSNSAPKPDQKRPDLVAARAPSDGIKRAATAPLPTAASTSSPAEKPATEQPSVAPAEESTPASQSPAAKHLAALQQKDGKPRNKTSRLRRAFSFGSAADFRKAGAVDLGATNMGEGQSSQDAGLDGEQARIAQKQEEGGIGSGIYGKKLFSASTDNLSVSSTASSASIMIRKMGRGVKRTSRSFVGLFRPKSETGAQDPSAPEASQAEVSMVTAEAERKAGASDGETRGSLTTAETRTPDLTHSPSPSSDRTSSGVTESSRRSIMGGDRERAEVLAAVRKGILKHSNGSSSSSRRTDGQDSLTSLDLPALPHMSDSPASSAPSTPNDDIQGQKQTQSVTIGNEDYFVAAMRLRQDTKSAPVSSPATPHGSMKRSATFSPRIIFYDTWPSQEYDRRGEIATCNRLTPLLAQQIKEELNTFKMEMEVHENSKVYTHFF